MALRAGERLGPYEILGAVGAGGMGEVYRARDPRLGRTVAIKVLPASVSSDPARRHRFEHEARADGPPQPPQHPRRPRRGRPRGRALSRRGASRGRDAARAAAGGNGPRSQGGGLRAAGGARPRGRARQGGRPPRPQAREPLRDEGRDREDPGLRPGAAGGGGATAEDTRLADADEGDGARRGAGDGRRTCRRSRPGARRWTTARTCSRWVRCSTRCCRAGVRSTGTRRWRR